MSTPINRKWSFPKKKVVLAIGEFLFLFKIYILMGTYIQEGILESLKWVQYVQQKAKEKDSHHDI